MLQVILAGRRRTALEHDLEDLASRDFWTVEELRLSARPGHRPDGDVT